MLGSSAIHCYDGLRRECSSEERERKKYILLLPSSDALNAAKKRQHHQNYCNKSSSTPWESDEIFHEICCARGNNSTQLFILSAA